MNYSYIYTLVLCVVAFVAANLLLNKPVTSIGMESIIAAVLTGGMTYYYFNVYNQNTVVIKTSPVFAGADQAPPTPAATQAKVSSTPITSEGPLERVQQGPFSSS
jgi:hypothetical protein